MDAKPQNRTWWAIIWLCTGVQLALIPVAVLARGPGWAAPPAFMAVLTAAMPWLQPKDPDWLRGVAALAFLVNALGFAVDLYRAPGVYDELAHLYTGFAVTLYIGHGLLRRRLLQAPPWLTAVLLTSLGLAIGSLWEIAELYTHQIGGLTDTVEDLALDAGGALVAAVLLAFPPPRLERSLDTSRRTET